MADVKAAEVKPKKYERGTPEGEKLIRVRWMRNGTYGPSPKLQRLYRGPCEDFPDGEECTIPMWRFTDYDVSEVVTGKNGEQMTFVGSHRRADMPKPIDDNVAKHSEEMQDVMAQNEELRRRLAAYDAHETLKAMPDEVIVIPDSPESFSGPKKRGKKEEI